MAAEEIAFWTREDMAWSPAEAPRLRALAPGRCMVFADWAEIQPEESRYDREAIARLRERLMRTISLGVEPVLCLYRWEAPAWFLAIGGWEREDNLRCYLRYVSRVVRALGHLVSEYVTFFSPNREAWNSGAVLSIARRTRVLSHMACDHVRAYRLIRDLREQRGWKGTRIGIVLRMAPERELRRGLLPMTGVLNARIYESLTLRAMALGEFRPPLRNVLRIRRGEWCDFVAVHCRPGVEEFCLKKAGEMVAAPLLLMRREEDG